LVKDRLDKTFPGKRVWTEYGEPSEVDAASRLAETNAHDFQWWAVRKLGGQPPTGNKKGRDGGIDGEMTLRDFDSEKRRRVIISVKGERNLHPDSVKALETTVDMEKADYGILVTMNEPSQRMRNVARECGPVPWASAQDGRIGHRIRIITVPEILAGTVQLPGRKETPRVPSSPPRSACSSLDPGPDGTSAEGGVVRRDEPGEVGFRRRTRPLGSTVVSSADVGHRG
jgi:hypothetical protein